MSVTERDRRLVFDRLVEAIGPEAANSLMELLPFQPTTELVTRSDMAASSSLLRGEMAELRGDLQSQMAELRTELRGEMAELRSDLQGEMAELRAELRGEMAELRGEMAALRGELKGEFYRWGAVIVGANTIAMITALIT